MRHAAFVMMSLGFLAACDSNNSKVDTPVDTAGTAPGLAAIFARTYQMRAAGTVSKEADTLGCLRVRPVGVYHSDAAPVCGETESSTSSRGTDLLRAFYCLPILAMVAACESDLEVAPAIVQWMEWPAEVRVATPFTVRLLVPFPGCNRGVFRPGISTDQSAVTFAPYFLVKRENTICLPEAQQFDARATSLCRGRSSADLWRSHGPSIRPG